MKTLRIWRRAAAMSLSAQLSHGVGSVGYLVGKLVRLLFFLGYLLAVFNHTDRVAGYSLQETVLFFLTYNLVDIVAMILFRGIYSARRVIQEGDLDYYLIQPCNPLFRMAAFNVDFLDVATTIPVLALLAGAWPNLAIGISPLRAVLYVALVLNGIAISLAIHVLVAAIAVRTQELENTIWVYRDLMFLGKFPADIYAPPLRWALTLAVPICVMVSFPAKALLGLLSPGWILYAFLWSAGAMGLSLWAWRKAIESYTSVSS